MPDEKDPKPEPTPDPRGRFERWLSAVLAHATTAEQAQTIAKEPDVEIEQEE